MTTAVAVAEPKTGQLGLIGGEGGQIVAWDNVPPDEQAKITALAAKLDLTQGKSTQSIMEFGAQAQKGTATFADGILNKVKGKDTGEVGKLLTELMLNCKSLDVQEIVADSPEGRVKGFLKSMFGGAKKQVERALDGVLAKYETLGKGVDIIVVQLSSHQQALMADVAMLEQLFEQNVDTFYELERCIYAAKLKLKELEETIIPAAQADAAANAQNLFAANRVKDLADVKNRLEKKINDLLLTRVITIQMAPQIRLIQAGNTTLAEKMQSSVLNTIPLWKGQFVIAIALLRQKQGAELQKMVTDTTNDLLAKNAEMLHTGAVAIAKENERAIVDIETLEKVNAELIGAIDDVKRIQQEGSAKRVESQAKLVQLEGQLREKILTA